MTGWWMVEQGGQDMCTLPPGWASCQGGKMMMRQRVPEWDGLHVHMAISFSFYPLSGQHRALIRNRQNSFQLVLNFIRKKNRDRKINRCHSFIFTVQCIMVTQTPPYWSQGHFFCPQWDSRWCCWVQWDPWCTHAINVFRVWCQAKNRVCTR